METVAKSTTRVSESAGCQNLKLMTVVKVVKFDVDVNVDESEHCLCQNVLDVQQLIFCVICSQNSKQHFVRAAAGILLQVKACFIFAIYFVKGGGGIIREAQETNFR